MENKDKKVIITRILLNSVEKHNLNKLVELWGENKSVCIRRAIKIAIDNELKKESSK